MVSRTLGSNESKERMEIPTGPKNRPPSQTMGSFSFSPDYDADPAELMREVEALKARIESLERRVMRLRIILAIVLGLGVIGFLCMRMFMIR